MGFSFYCYNIYFEREKKKRFEFINSLNDIEPFFHFIFSLNYIYNHHTIMQKLYYYLTNNVK
jgi:hypothetical protein